MARLAQSVEHETLNLGVVGSSPTLGDFFPRYFVYFDFFSMNILHFLLIKTSLTELNLGEFRFSQFLNFEQKD
jgi:hypothetical protein